ncbi:MAG: hypothetical protein C4297_02825 [Gemmataceae bacterium]
MTRSTVVWHPMCSSILPIVLILAGAPVFVQAAEPARKIGLDEAVHLALEKQPALAGARASRDAASEQKRAADSLLALLTGPQIHVRRKQAELGLAIAQSQVEQAELETINAVTRTYLSVLFAKEQERVAEEALANFKAMREAARGLVKAGSKEVTTSDLERLDMYTALAAARLEEARTGQARARIALREAIGLAPQEPIEVADDRLTYKPVKVSCTKAVELALQHRPELVQALLAADLARLEVKAQGLTLSANARTFAATGDIHAKILPASVINGDYRPGPLGPEMPAFLAGSWHQRRARAESLADRAEAVAEKARNLIALEVEEACLRLQQHGREVELLKATVQQAIKQGEEARRAYRAEQLPTDRLLIAQLAESQVKAQYNEAVYRYAIAQATLHRVTGGRFWDAVEKEDSK